MLSFSKKIKEHYGGSIINYIFNNIKLKPNEWMSIDNNEFTIKQMVKVELLTNGFLLIRDYKSKSAVFILPKVTGIEKEDNKLIFYYKNKKYIVNFIKKKDIYVCNFEGDYPKCMILEDIIGENRNIGPNIPWCFI